MILAYFRAARRESSSLLAPVHTILPELKMSAVVRGSRIRIITAAKRFGLYSAFLACNAIFFRSNLQFRFTVETMFLQREYLKFSKFVELSAQRHTVVVVRFRGLIRESLVSSELPGPSFGEHLRC